MTFTGFFPVLWKLAHSDFQRIMTAKVDLPSILKHPMRTQTIEGTSEQIAQRVIEMDGRVVRAIVFIEEPLDAKPTGPAEDIFVEMSPFTVSVGNADDPRDSIYCQQDGE